MSEHSDDRIKWAVIRIHTGLSIRILSTFVAKRLWGASPVSTAAENTVKAVSQLTPKLDEIIDDKRDKRQRQLRQQPHVGLLALIGQRSGKSRGAPQLGGQ